MEDKITEHQPLLKVELELTGDVNGGKEGGTTCVLCFSIFIAVCGSFVSGCGMGYSSPAESGILAELGLSTADYSLFGSMVTIGGLLGSLVCGKLTDFIGRRGTMWLSDGIFLSGWLAIAFSKGVWSLDLGRLAVGFGIALISYAVPVYLAEITPKNLRGGSVLLHQLMASCGLSFVYIVGLAITWRVLALAGAIPCLIQLMSLFFVPESPRWLVKVGRGTDCVAALRSLRGEKTDISQEAAEIKEYTQADKSISEDKFMEVFQRKYAYALRVTLGLMALSALGGASGIAFYASTIFESAGFSSTVGTVAMALVQLPPTVLGVFLMDYFGRRPILLYSAGGMCVSCLSLALSFLMEEHGWIKVFSPYLALLGILVTSAAYPVGLGGIPYLIMSEIIPMSIKGAAGSLATVVSFGSTWIVSYSFNFMMQGSSSGTFFIFLGTNLFALLFIAKFVPETKGRTLEELQESFT